MSLTSLLAHYKYRRKALNRHGIHSPFVYDLADKVLLNKRAIGDTKGITATVEIPEKYRHLVDKIIAYYQSCTPLFPYTPHFIQCSPQALLQQDLLSKAQSGTLIIVGSINASPKLFADWLQITQNAMVKLSIDLGDIGLLFFCDAFKQKQHFILQRYL